MLPPGTIDPQEGSLTWSLSNEHTPWCSQHRTPDSDSIIRRQPWRMILSTSGWECQFRTCRA